MRIDLFTWGLYYQGQEENNWCAEHPRYLYTDMRSMKINKKKLFKALIHNQGYNFNVVAEL